MLSCSFAKERGAEETSSVSSETYCSRVSSAHVHNAPLPLSPRSASLSLVVHMQTRIHQRVHQDMEFTYTHSLHLQPLLRCPSKNELRTPQARGSGGRGIRSNTAIAARLVCVCVYCVCVHVRAVRPRGPVCVCGFACAA